MGTFPHVVTYICSTDYLHLQHQRACPTFFSSKLKAGMKIIIILQHITKPVKSVQRHCSLLYFTIFSAYFKLLVTLSPVSLLLLLVSVSCCDGPLSLNNSQNTYMVKFLHLIKIVLKISQMYACIGPHSGNKVRQLSVMDA